MYLSIHKKVLVGFCLAVLVLSLIGQQFYQSMNQLIEAENWYSHTHEVIGEIRGIVAQIQDAQRGQRGYIITGDPAYLAPYFGSGNKAWTELDKLRALTQDNPDQQKHLDHLRPLVEQFFAIMAHVSQVRGTQGFDAAADIVKSGRGKILMDRILVITVQMEAEENRLLKVRHNNVQDSVNLTILTALVGAVVILTILGILYFLINGEMNRRMQMTQQLRESEERLNFALDGSNDGLWDWNIKTDEIYFSPRWLEMLGYASGQLEAKSQTLDKLLHPDDMASTKRALEACLSGQNEKYAVEQRLLTCGGEWKWVMVRGKVVSRDQEGRPLRMVGTHTDIHDKKQAESVLQLANETAMQAVRMKSQFLANMSHEIRTPMNGMLGLAELVLKTELSSEQRKNLKMVQTSGKALLTIINDILDFSKIEAGKLELDPVPFKLRECLDETMNLFSQAARQKELELLYRVDSNVPNHLIGDPTRLRQVINNLIGNAIKFTQTGEILVDVVAESRPGKELGQDKVQLHVTVSDTGIGLTADKQEQIFQPFEQADGSTTRRFGGTGLGLSISKSLMALMGGSIWVESEPGKGSRFHFIATLDIQAKPPEPIIPLDVQLLKGMPVLLVDDNGTNLYILKEMLESYGMKPTALNRGQDALDEMKKTAYSLAILDVNMPEMDGFTLAQQIKGDPELHKIRVILLTSSGEAGDAARCKELGVEGYLTKPAGESTVLKTLLAVLHPESKPLETLGAPVTRHLLREHYPKLKILLAEDNEINQVFTQQVLHEAGCMVITVNNGEEALKKLKTQLFDVILMDIQMPIMDGFEATAAIREWEKETGGHMPIIALTANAIKGDQELYLSRGMDGYVAKPFESWELLDAIQTVTKVSEVDIQALESRMEQKTILPDVPEEASLLDRDRIMDRLGENLDILNKVVLIFAEQYPNQIQTIEQAIQDQDSQRLQESAHQLKGAIGNFTQKAPYQSALRLEKMGREADLSQAETELANLRKTVEQLKTALFTLAQGESPE
jgi:two-component system sensor histidine kinase/response regulator